MDEEKSENTTRQGQAIGDSDPFLTFGTLSGMVFEYGFTNSVQRTWNPSTAQLKCGTLLPWQTHLRDRFDLAITAEKYGANGSQPRNLYSDLSIHAACPARIRWQGLNGMGSGMNVGIQINFANVAGMSIEWSSRC